MGWIIYCSIIVVLLVLVYKATHTTYKIHNSEEFSLWLNIKTILENKDFLTNDELSLSEKEKIWLYWRHEELYEREWYCADPLSSKQIQLIMYDHIKNKIK